MPSLSKKIIYLDQFFLSAAFKDKDGRVLEAASLVKQAAADQVLIAPYSSVHEDETHQWRGYDGRSSDDLMEFIKATSRGHEFEPSYRIENAQIVSAFGSYLRGETSEFQITRRTALDRDVDHWEDYFRIDVGHYRGDIELLRQLKRTSVEQLVKDVFPQWRASNIGFDDQVRLEIRTSSRSYIAAYSKYAGRMVAGDYTAQFDSPIVSMIVEDMLQLLPRHMAYEEKVRTVHAYFDSEHFFNVPHEWISARIFAVLHAQVRDGAFPNEEDALRRLSGFFQDVKHASFFAPYVDVFVTDQVMASILKDGRVNLEHRYGTKIISMKNWPELIDWLKALIEDESDEHKAALRIAYP